MIALLQRVTCASVTIEEKITASIDCGLLVFLAIQKDDDEIKAERLVERLLTYRVFSDSEGKMNNNVKIEQGGILLVPQFTLAADTSKGLRPNFSKAASPEMGKKMFDYFLNILTCKYDKVAAGTFGADMQIQLVNDGPVTFWLELK